VASERSLHGSRDDAESAAEGLQRLAAILQAYAGSPSALAHDFEGEQR
jgi:hypothetical protein